MKLTDKIVVVTQGEIDPPAHDHDRVAVLQLFRPGDHGELARVPRQHLLVAVDHARALARGVDALHRGCGLRQSQRVLGVTRRLTEYGRGRS